MLDTKWKNFKYSKTSKGLTSLLILLSGSIFIWCLMWFAIYGDRTVSDIADSGEYASELFRRTHNITEVACVLKSIEHINQTTEDEEERYRLYRRYNSANDNVEKAPNFIYIIKDTKTSEVIKSNTPWSAEKLLSQKSHLYFSEDVFLIQYGNVKEKYELSNYLGYTDNNYSRYYGEDILSFLSSEKYELYVAIKDDLVHGDVFYDLSLVSDKTSVFMIWWQPLLLARSIIFGLGLVLMAIICGRTNKNSKVQINGFDRVFTELQVCTFSGLVVFFLILIANLRFDIDVSTNVFGVSTQLLMGAIILAMIGLVFYCSLVRQIKAKILFKTSLFHWMIQKIKKACWRLSGLKLLKPRWILFFSIYGLALMFIGAMRLYFLEALVVFLFITLVFGFFLLKSLSALEEIMKTTKSISEGELEQVLDTNHYPPVFRNFYDDLYNVQLGMKKAIDNAIKGERLKTELITNVSHDLKTPLTSIISYVDLLDKQNIDNVQAKEYIEVLVRKSDTLKRLIDDLIEASKVSSGNVKIALKNLEINELIRQGIGEFKERFDEKELDIRVSEKENITILADGQSMWRVLDNLMDNIVKYSLSASRVYVQIYKEEDYGVFVLKNISETPLEIQPEELMERFVRGSESRTAQGSGLGLSIAEGLVKVQNGRFEIEIDGDLFKIIVKLPLSQKQEETDENLD